MDKGKTMPAAETVLVTGGAGYIGSHVVRDLAARGYRPLVLDNLSGGRREAVLAGELVTGDVGDIPLVVRLLQGRRIRSVLHFAAFIVVEESLRQPAKYYENNSLNTFRLLQACLENGVEHFIFSSTAAVYGIPTKIPVDEEAPLAPINPYGNSKLLAEIVLRDLATAHPGFSFVSLRYFNVVGADRQARIGQNHRQPTHLLTRALKTALGQFPSLTVFGSDYPTPDGTAVRDYIHVDDLSSAHLLALDFLKRERRSRVFNCGYGRGYSVLEMVSAARRVSGCDFAVEVGPRRPGDPPALVADASRIRRELGWQPEYSDLDRMVETAWNWEKKLAGR